MTKGKFKKLKVGDVVALAEPRPIYTCGENTPDERCYVPAGAVGNVGAVKVPNVMGKNEYFCCVDFPMSQLLFDHKGNPAKSWSNRRVSEMSRHRVAAHAEELI